MAGIRDSISANSSSKVNFTNLILRILQIVFGIAVVGFYASMYGSDLNKYANSKNDNTIQDKLTLGVVVGALSVVTAIAFALLPALVSYYYVAIAFLWEWILFFVWCSLFGWFHATAAHLNAIGAEFGGKIEGDVTRLGQWTWVDLVNMLLWLSTAVMSVVCLLVDRNSLRAGRSGV